MNLRRAQTAILSGIAGLFIVPSGVFGVTVAEAHQYLLLSSTSACASRPAAAARVVSLVTMTSAASPSPSPSPSASPTASAPVSASAPPATTAGPSASPSASASPAASKSPSPSPSPTPTPSPTKSPKPSPSPTPKPKPKTAQLCVLVQAFSSSSVRPGRTASYAIWVWSTVAEAQGVSVTASVGSAAHVNAPRFTVCPKASGDVCSVGTLPTGQSEELVAGSSVGSAASAGEHVTLTATAQAAKAGSFHSAATIDVVAASTPPATTDPSLPSSTLGSSGLPPLPTGLTSPTDPSGLFPTVSPTTPSSPAAAAADPARKRANHSDARDVSATLPLDTRLIGGQLVGLAVLAGAIAVAIARLSLRGPRPRDGGDAAK